MKRILFLLLLCGSAQAGWQQTFADEFDGPVDFKKWQTTDHFGVRTYSGGGVQEMQCYDDAALSTSNGNLVISVTRQAMPACRGTQAPDRMQYRSGRITSLNSFSQAYGYFETRMLFPAGQGFWPAFWMLPTTGFAWEIDGMEAVGKEPNTAYLTYHAWATQQHEGYPYRAPAALSGSWHTYGVDWQPGRLIWYVDGVERGRTSRLNDRIPTTPGYILVNLAVGGGWPGDPNASTVIPNQMLVDYVRAWRRVSDGKPDTLPPTVGQVAPDAQPLATPAVRISDSADRSNPAPLQGAAKTWGDSVYVFVPEAGIKSVTFWLDSATPAAPTETAFRVENLAPFDFAGTDAQLKALPLVIAGMSVGRHTITARATNLDNTLRTPVTASFTVSYAPLDMKLLGQRLSDSITALRAQDSAAALTLLRQIRTQLDLSGN